MGPPWAIRKPRRRLDLRPEQREIHHLRQGEERITRLRQLLQPSIDVEEPQLLPHHPSPHHHICP